MSTMTACPIIHVTKAAPVFQYDSCKPIRIGLSPDEAQSAILEITERVDTYDRACQPAVKASTTTNDSSETKIDPYVTKSIANGKMMIVASAMDKSFHEKYRKDLLRYTNARDVLKFIGQIFGEQNERQRQASARLEISNATRRIHDNEPFSLFLDRLKSMAKSTSAKEEIRNDIVDNAFRTNLSPTLNMFLLEHDKLELSVTEIATYLDQKQKHSRATSVNAIQLNKMEEMEKMILNLTQLVQESLFNKSNAAVEINHVQKQKNKRPGTKSNVNRYCTKCGMFNHKTDECSGKCHLTCRRCNKQGHLAVVCPLPKNE